MHQFTRKDQETGLNYFGTRYFSPLQRTPIFTSARLSPHSSESGTIHQPGL